MNNLKKIRCAKKMTLVQVASKLGTTHTQVRRLEIGERRLTQDWMIRFAKVLDVDVIDLINDTELSKTSLKNNHSDDLIYWIIESCVASAREQPKLPASIMAAIGRTTYRMALSGKLPDIKPRADNKKPPKSLENEIQRLIAYERDRLN